MIQGKKGQIAIFVVVALLIVASGVFYYFKFYSIPSEKDVLESMPVKLRVVEEYFVSCLKDVSFEGVQLLGSGGGYIDAGDVSDSGSVDVDAGGLGDSLEFMGMNVLYWYYVDNGLDVVRVPSIESMESELGKYVEDNLWRCLDFSVFEDEGFDVGFGREGSVRAVIEDDRVEVGLRLPVDVSFEGVRSKVARHGFILDVELGELYESARKILNAEVEGKFLEERTIDVIYLYEEIPSSEVSLECFSRMWLKKDVESNLKRILGDNIPFVKVSGSEYVKSDDYFVVDVGLGRGTGVNFMFLGEPFFFDVMPGGDVLRGETVTDIAPEFLRGLFCLSSYNFVYDVMYPVMVVLHSDGFMFQFPMVVRVDNNQVRKAEVGESVGVDEGFCDRKVSEMTVFTYAVEGNELVELGEVDVSFKCMNVVCDIGRTLDDGRLVGKFPECVNGFVIGGKEGYGEGKVQVSTNYEGVSVNVVLDKLFEEELDVRVLDGGMERGLLDGEEALILFESEDYSTSVLYPSLDSVRLREGEYEVKVYLFARDKFLLEGESYRSCEKVPASGFKGVLGLSEEVCQDIVIPDMEVEQVLFGGNVFRGVFESGELSKGGMRVYANAYDVPKTVEDLSVLYAELGVRKIGKNVEFF